MFSASMASSATGGTGAAPGVLPGACAAACPCARAPKSTAALVAALARTAVRRMRRLETASVRFIEDSPLILLEWQRPQPSLRRPGAPDPGAAAGAGGGGCIGSRRSAVAAAGRRRRFPGRFPAAAGRLDKRPLGGAYDGPPLEQPAPTTDQLRRARAGVGGRAGGAGRVSAGDADRPGRRRQNPPGACRRRGGVRRVRRWGLAGGV